MQPGTIPNILLWMITALALTVLATGLIAGERSRQTLDVLLATPIPTREILRQKLAGVKKVSRVMAIPLLTVLIYGMTLRHPHLNVLRSDWETLRGLGWQLVQGIAPIIVYPAIVTWLGFHCGMRMRNQGQAMLMTLALIVAWCAIPALLHEPFRLSGQQLFGPCGWATFSPILYVIEPARDSMLNRGMYGNTLPKPQEEWNTFVVHFSTLLVAWLFLRWRGIATFGRLLKRNDGMPEPDDLGASISSERGASAP